MADEQNVGDIFHTTEKLWRLDQKHRGEIVNPAGCGLEYGRKIETCLKPVGGGVERGAGQVNRFNSHYTHIQVKNKGISLETWLVGCNYTVKDDTDLNVHERSCPTHCF